MSWLDDLRVRVEEVIPDGIRNDIGSYLQSRLVDPVIAIGQPQAGNLTAAQIAAGERGAAAATAPAQPVPVSVNGVNVGNGGGMNMATLVPMLAIGALAIALIVTSGGGRRR